MKRNCSKAMSTSRAHNQGCRSWGYRGCKRTHKSFDLSKIWAKSQNNRAQKFWLLWTIL